MNAIPDFILNPRIAGRYTDEPARKRKPKTGKALMDEIEARTPMMDDVMDKRRGEEALDVSEEFDAEDEATSAEPSRTPTMLH